MGKLQFMFFRYLLNKFYNSQKMFSLTMLSSDSEAFENQYKEERYKYLENLGVEGRRTLQKLMALDVNYLNRKIHDSEDVAKINFMRGRIFQNLFYFSASDLVSNVQKKKELAQKNDE